MKNDLRFIFLGIALMLCGGASYAASFEDGIEAFERGDFSSALRIFRTLVEQGEAFAQFKLGEMNREG